ncbi:MAG: Exodeoxyribonuclease 7 small subunit [Candidatus Uhrbacteria bacterium GW2011_GWF2_41_16]|uniref:Exodeoxyribonuclease 7 small subunit n=2 Tax=Candidatus Uhriibacteriota TaxID=1752732 RepID=A0A0G0XP34_9BACT|nr:MAG: Exodeoxyribonuclease 7 small subunit [Candidatus Uhrbacteria bacterium GW2011_GWA2_41_10]KKR87600.1 MAG: Exodeoxyribonuclease 7 small subunit [Candidatus Uhrbacteria bacterium GW2011_GWC2_41_11]KKR98580.1 MAG: Exodeoxyribonuclease 7 small subunit [Candidatus Uhrbacteria bacterium GW2011_GWF2_41_16]HBO99800.1 exodeoxyribonuclease VII small subunit [Candidatus Uhrbacteria bacterium]
MATKAKTISFAKAFEELESITEWFEKGEVDLDEGLKKFERGLELAQSCKTKLAEVETRVREIKQKFHEEESENT